MADDVWGDFGLDKVPTKELKQGAGDFSRPVKDDVWGDFGIDKKEEIKAEPKKPTIKELESNVAKLGMSKGMFLKPFMENIPGHKTMSEGVSPSLTKGVPVAGRFVPQTPELSQFEKDNPIVSKGLNIAGNVGSTLPLAAGAAARSGAGFLPQWAGQTAATVPLNVADRIAEKGNSITSDDIKKEMLMGGASSLIPAGATSLIGQAARSNYPYSQLPDYIKALKGREGPMFGPARPYPSNPMSTPNSAPGWAQIQAQMHGGKSVIPGQTASAAPMTPKPTMSGAIPGSNIPGAGHTLTGAAAAGLGMYHYGLPGIIGAALTPWIHRGLQTAGNTRAGQLVDAAAHHPSVQDILRIMAAQKGHEMAPELALP